MNLAKGVAKARRFGNCRRCKHHEQESIGVVDDYGNQLAVNYTVMNRRAEVEHYCKLLDIYIDFDVVNQFNAGFYKEYIVLEKETDQLIWNEDVDDETIQMLGDFDPNDDDSESQEERSSLVDIAGKALMEDVVLVNLGYMKRMALIDTAIYCEFYCP